MINLSNFFEKFRNLNKNKENTTLEVIKIIKEVSLVTISPTEIYLEESFVKINTSPLKRGEVFMYKDKILKEFKIKNLNLKDIR